MFGLIYAGIVGVTNAIGNLKNSIDDYDGKKRGIQRKANGGNTENIYFDHKGRIRDIQTNEFRDLRMKNGDWILSDNNLNVLRNLSEEKRENEFLKLKNEADSDTKAVFYKHWSFNNTPIKIKSTRITGDVYRDVHTNELYIVRYIAWNRDDLSEKMEIIGENGLTRANMECADFYLNPNTAEIVDVTDQWKKKHKNADMDKINAFIEHFNNEQRKGGWKALARKYGSIQSLYIHA